MYEITVKFRLAEVHTLDSALEKVKNIAAASVQSVSTPVSIKDVTVKAGTARSR